MAVSYDDRFLFMQELGYDGAGSVTGHVPQYSGLVTLKDETWFSEGAAPVTSAKIYRYDYAGRLSFEGVQSGTSYTYDARGNMLTYGMTLSIVQRMSTLDYSGDRLTTLSRYRKEYNFLNLVRKYLATARYWQIIPILQTVLSLVHRTETERD